MKVAVSVLGRFHGFDLAAQLYRADALDRLITSYPKFKAMEWGIPKELIQSHLIHEMNSRFWQRIGPWTLETFNHQFMVHEAFDKAVANKFPNSADLFVGWSSSSLHSIRRAKKEGILTLLERGSTHISHQTTILKEEAERLGIKTTVTHPKIIEKELQEYQESDFIVVPTTYVAKTFLDQGVSSKKLIVNPYGVNLGQFKPGEKLDEVFRVIHCGGLTIQKGVHHLLQAFVELDLPNSELWLIGSRSKEIFPFLDRYPQSNIKVLGPFPQNDLARYYQQASVFCLASLQEGYGMVLLQAMACGLPIIATNVSGACDLIQDGIEGFKFSPGDIETFKEKLQFLFQSKHCRISMGQAAKSRVSDGFSWFDYGCRTLNFYHQVLKS